jgi:cytoskeleton protein RodZ
LTFTKKLVLKLGNAGGVRIRLDGRELEPPGTAGQVKTLTFPANS